MSAITVIGIDPGQTGGIAVIRPYGGIDVTVMPVVSRPKGGGHELDLGSLVTTLENYANAHVFVERAQAFPRGGVAGMFNYGRDFGAILGVLAAIPLKYTLVHPRVWTKVMHVGTPGGDPKARSVIACQRLFPAVRLTVGKGTTPHAGIVDALLIAEWGRRSLNGAT